VSQALSGSKPASSPASPSLSSSAWIIHYFPLLVRSKWIDIDEYGSPSRGSLRVGGRNTAAGQADHTRLWKPSQSKSRTEYQTPTPLCSHLTSFSVVRLRRASERAEAEPCTRFRYHPAFLPVPVSLTEHSSIPHILHETFNSRHGPSWRRCCGEQPSPYPKCRLGGARTGPPTFAGH